MRKDVWLVLLAAVLWGTTGTAQALAVESNPLAIGALRLFIGGGALFLVVLFKRSIRLRGLPKKALIISALAMALYQPLFFTGVDWTGVAAGTVITICSAPIFAGIFEWFIYKRRPNWIWSTSTLLAIIGCVLLFESRGEIEFNSLGVVFSLGAGFVFAIYTFVNKELVNQYPPDLVVAIVFSTAAIFLLPILFFVDLQWLLEPSGVLSVLHLGLIATALAYFLFSVGLKGVTASTGVTLALAEPVTAALLGIFLLKESMTTTGYFGILLLIVGLLLLSNKEKIMNYINK